MPKLYDLEERTYQFAKNVANCTKKLKKSLSNLEYAKQVIRSSGSVGANYIEANESLGDKNFLMRIRISRKEAKESAYWLRLLLETNETLNNGNEIQELFNESIELKKILSTILEKSKRKFERIS